MGNASYSNIPYYLKIHNASFIFLMLSFRDDRQLFFLTLFYTNTFYIIQYIIQYNFRFLTDRDIAVLFIILRSWI